jgi:hypothetical protein
LLSKPKNWEKGCCSTNNCICDYNKPYLLGTVKVVFTIGKHLGLNNGDNAVSLADGGIPGKYIGILKDGLKTNLNPSNLE